MRFTRREVLFACPSFPLLAQVRVRTETWVALFDGATLKGWHVACKPEDAGRQFWSVRESCITCDSRGLPGHDYVWLISDREFSDFELRLKVRGFRESKGNSGVQVRSRYDSDARWLDGPQVDIHPPAPWRTGLIYDETREVKRWIFPSLRNWDIEASSGPKQWKWKYADEGDGWNDLHVVCRGTNIQTVVNGIRIADLDGAGLLDDEAHRKHNVGLAGHIALQLHTGDDLYIQYKDLLIR